MHVLLSLWSQSHPLGAHTDPPRLTTSMWSVNSLPKARSCKQGTHTQREHLRTIQKGPNSCCCTLLTFERSPLAERASGSALPAQSGPWQGSSACNTQDGALSVLLAQAKAPSVAQPPFCCCFGLHQLTCVLNAAAAAT
jgi:hypothetical protein